LEISSERAIVNAIEVGRGRKSGEIEENARKKYFRIVKLNIVVLKQLELKCETQPL